MSEASGFETQSEIDDRQSVNLHSPFCTLVSQVGLPLGLCFYLQATGQLQASGIWLAIVLGHFTRCVLSAARFHQGRWKTLAV